MTWLISRTKGDLVIWGIVLCLSLFSILAVYSSTETMAYKLKNGNTEYYLFKHVFLMIFGLIMMYFAHTINYKYYSRIAQIWLIMSIPLLIITFFLGGSVNGISRHRWNLTFNVRYSISLSFPSKRDTTLAAE